VIFKIVPPAVRGFQWALIATNENAIVQRTEFPEDQAPIGIMRPAVSRTS